MAVRNNFVWVFNGYRRPPGTGNAQCGECKKNFKFIIDVYCQYNKLVKCTHCGNTKYNSIFVPDPNGSFEKAKETVDEYVKKHSPYISQNNPPKP
jgi:hypothetical protein